MPELPHEWEKSLEPRVWFCLHCLVRSTAPAAHMPCIKLLPELPEPQTPISGS